MNRKTLNIIYWVLLILFSGFMLMSGISHLSMSADAQGIMDHLGYPQYLNIMLGVAKVLGVIGIIQWWFPVLREWAYAGFFFDIVAAAVSMNLNGDPVANSLFALIFLVPLFLCYFMAKKRAMAPSAVAGLA